MKICIIRFLWHINIAINKIYNILFRQAQTEEYVKMKEKNETLLNKCKITNTSTVEYAILECFESFLPTFITLIVQLYYNASGIRSHTAFK